MTGIGNQPPHTSHIDPLDRRPTLCARLLGTELRRIREAASLTVGEVAALTDLEPNKIRQLESGIGPDVPASESTVWCQWGTLTMSMINSLCRNAERIDIFAPLGIHPALGPLDVDRCTAYVLEDFAADRRDVTVRVIRHGGRLYPGIEHHPITRFTLPDGPAVVLYAYLHAAQFTEEEQHLLAAYTLFDELAGFTGTTGSA
ncbi:helix-turn-helix domain-containing protein [Actinosynnema sp. NPDC023587]|uniref:helix-turn-helix domain-containing protein n=1 Tax=Actinosynnema sp. NPDC023587 TaxID=3154695 RepID=UPI0034033E20